MLQHSESVPGWVQDCNISIANALEILQSYSEPSIWPFWVKHISHQCWLPCCSILKVCLAECKTAISPLLMHWRYCSLALNHQYDLSGSNTLAISAGVHAAAFWECAWLCIWGASWRFTVIQCVDLADNKWLPLNMSTVAGLIQNDTTGYQGPATMDRLWHTSRGNLVAEVRKTILSL